MKTIIGKELRENLKLAFPVCLVLTVFLMYATWDGGTGLVDKGLVRITSVFYAVFGAALGWLQIHHERPRDLWAFLVHRPISRTEIFLAKVTAGLLLYAVSTSLPMLGYIIWVQIPGNVGAPFEWAMVMPELGCFLLGIIWYFAAMLTSLSRARWYASRGLGLAAAFPSHAVALGLPGVLIYWQFDVALLVPATLLATAIWGCIHKEGSFRARPVPAKAAQATVFACGSTVLIVLTILCLSFVFHQRQDSQYYAVTKDGKVFHVRSRDSYPTIITDLSGARLKDPKTGQDMDIQEFNKLVCQGQGIPVDLGDPPHSIPDPREPREYFLLNWRYSDGILWDWTRHGYLVGYDEHTRRFVASLAPPGSPSGVPQVMDRFLRPTRVSNQIAPRTLATASALYEVNLRNRSAKRIFGTPEGDRIGGTRDVSENATVVVSKQCIQLLTPDGKSLWRVPHDREYRQPTFIDVFPLDATNQYALWIYSPRLQSQKSEGKIRRQMVWISADQGVTRRTELPAADPPNPADALWDKLLSFFVPPEFPFIKPLLFRLAVLHVPIQWELVRISLLAAAFCVAAGWWIGSRYHFAVRTKLAWAVFHLLAGFPGLLAFLSVHEWPAGEPCPGCKRLRTVDRAQCPHCGADFAPPEKDGTEIFEAVDTLPL